MAFYLCEWNTGVKFIDGFLMIFKLPKYILLQTEMFGYFEVLSKLLALLLPFWVLFKDWQKNKHHRDYQPLLIKIVVASFIYMFVLYIMEFVSFIYLAIYLVLFSILVGVAVRNIFSGGIHG